MEPTGTIGQSVVIKGELSAKEDLTIEGQVEGKIEMEQNMLTVGVNGRIKAQVLAKAVVVRHGYGHERYHGDREAQPLRDRLG